MSAEREGGGGHGGALPFGVVDVAGPSMVPTLYEGDLVLVRYGCRIRPGAVVLFRHPLRQDLLVVKRAEGRRGRGWWLLSDNHFVDSDSREYGAVPDDLVLGRVLLRLRPRPVWLAPAPWLERALTTGPLSRLPRLAARLGVRRRLSPEL
ncbi:nickel-type superoxide dismutase maturation protease [Kitasatospora sp. MAP5-34]|uniref:nickel-type superoxide dismutase maturation protease n=1 Tax=Kitasatospora sp. MAP5-34 TaxID=3035102 RepID=UPI002473B0FD|nr:nickel-type superoxide dismutase maturation protease [Kitasatospora sp. MAP5-34]MDH6575614.1 nickel-type superoxide dismutase maturation protease [Kitasatospora sp. MAP5-34]